MRRQRAKWLAGILLLAVLLLTGCGWKGQGVVVEKTYSPAHTGLMLVGKVMVPTNYSASWGYKIRDENGEIHDVSVNHEYWVTHEVGASWDNREKK